MRESRHPKSFRYTLVQKETARSVPTTVGSITIPVRKMFEIKIDQNQAWRDIGFLKYPKNAKQFLKEHTRKSVNLNSVLFLSYTIREAEEYYASAENSSFLTRPLLLYYGMLSLIKGFICSHTPEDFSYGDPIKHHGLSLRNRRRKGYRFDTWYVHIKDDGAFPRLRKVLGQEPLVDRALNIGDLLARIPELFDSYRCTYPKNSTLGRKKGLLPIRDCAFAQDETKFSKYNFSFSVPEDYREDPTSVHTFEKYITSDEFGKYRIQIQRARTPQNRSQIKEAERQAVREISRMTFYVDSETLFLPTYIPVRTWVKQSLTRTRLSELELHFLLMFLLGSLARYHAVEWGQIWEGGKSNHAYVLEDFIEVSCRKFPVLFSWSIFDDHDLLVLPHNLLSYQGRLFSEDGKKLIAKVRYASTNKNQGTITAFDDENDEKIRKMCSTQNRFQLELTGRRRIPIIAKFPITKGWAGMARYCRSDM